MKKKFETFQFVFGIDLGLTYFAIIDTGSEF